MSCSGTLIRWWHRRDRGTATPRPSSRYFGRSGERLARRRLADLVQDLVRAALAQYRGERCAGRLRVCAGNGAGYPLEPVQRGDLGAEGQYAVAADRERADGDRAAA